MQTTITKLLDDLRLSNSALLALYFTYILCLITKKENTYNAVLRFMTEVMPKSHLRHKMVLFECPGTIKGLAATDGLVANSLNLA